MICRPPAASEYRILTVRGEGGSCDEVEFSLLLLTGNSGGENASIESAGLVGLEDSDMKSNIEGCAELGWDEGAKEVRLLAECVEIR